MTDPAPLTAARLDRLRRAMADAGHEALVLTAAGAVRYATGVVPPHGDASAEAARPFAAVVRADRVALFGVDGAAPLPHDPARAAGTLADSVGDARRVGVDRVSFALGAALARALPRAELVGAEASVLAARAVKTADEVALLRAAQALNEAAIGEVLPAIVPGVREIDLTGRFLAAMARCGVTACHVEPIWCVVPRSARDAPWTFAGGLPYRELTSERVLATGDQVMIDTGMLHGGYMSDFGCTWTCGAAPDQALRTRWEDIVAAVLAECRPGRTGAALHAAALAANGRGRPAPWPVPLYLAHGIGIGGVEPPFVGTDLGRAAEEAMVLVPGMVLVLEPYVWEEGAGGYRAEVMVAITDAGCERLSAPPP